MTIFLDDAQIEPVVLDILGESDPPRLFSRNDREPPDSIVHCGGREVRRD